MLLLWGMTEKETVGWEEGVGFHTTPDTGVWGPVILTPLAKYIAQSLQRLNMLLC